MILSKHSAATLFLPERAEEIARDLQAADEDGWKFTPIHDPEGAGFSFVEVRDEDGALIGKL